MNANHKDADLWIQVRHKEQDLRLRVAWVKGHTHLSRGEGGDDAADQANCNGQR